MDKRLSEAERKTLNNFMRTDLGGKVLDLIKDSQQSYLDTAMLITNQGPQATHDCVVAAAAVGTIYQFLKPPKPKENDEE